MTSKQGYNPDFSEFFNKKVLLKLEDKRELIGTVESVDHFMNMVLDQAIFVSKGESQRLNKTMIRGKCIISWKFLD